MKTNKAKKVNSTENNDIKEDKLKDEISDKNVDKDKNDNNETKEKNYCQRD